MNQRDMSDGEKGGDRAAPRDVETDNEVATKALAAEVERQAFAPGWEKEHGTDYSDFLDSVFDEDDPLHDEAIK